MKKSTARTAGAAAVAGLLYLASGITVNAGGYVGHGILIPASILVLVSLNEALKATERERNRVFSRMLKAKEDFVSQEPQEWHQEMIDGFEEDLEVFVKRNSQLRKAVASFYVILALHVAFAAIVPFLSWIWEIESSLRPIWMLSPETLLATFWIIFQLAGSQMRENASFQEAHFSDPDTRLNSSE